MHAVGAVLVVAAVLAPGTLASAQGTERVNVDSSGTQADGGSQFNGLAISADGQIVAFASGADNLIANDANGRFADIFVHDRATGITECVSVDSSGQQSLHDHSLEPAMSQDGRFVVFASFSPDFVSGDTNGHADVFVHDRSTGITERVSVDSSGAQGNGDSGLWSSYTSLDCEISGDGQVVAFSSFATNLVPNDTNGVADVFVHDRATGVTERVSVDSSGAQANGNFTGWNPDSIAISGDGRFIAFQSDASNLVSGDTNAFMDVFLRDRATGTTERVSLSSTGSEGNKASLYPAISADGQVVAFCSNSDNLVAGDTNGCMDVFARDRSAGLTELASVDSTGVEGNSNSGEYDFEKGIDLSADGWVVAFYSYAQNLVSGDTNGVSDIFVHDRVTGITERVDVSSVGAQADSITATCVISGEGMSVAFDSWGTNLVSGDTNGLDDTFVHDRCSTLAAWTNYGSGFPGTNGVPAFTSRQNPSLGSTVTVDLDNSYGSPTVGMIFVGFQRTSIPTHRGGDLLVLPSLVVPISFSYSGDTLSGDIATDPSLCGVTIDLQAVETDPGAAKGMSFTAGLELVIGR